ncbi:MAG: AAA family ATPase [Rubripirellula sp.]|nr:AAA family ATPase [Rubripirellula sp.]
MTNALRVALVDPNDQSRESLKQLLEMIGEICVEGDCSRYELFVSLVEQTQPDIAIINLDSDIEKSLLVIQQLNLEAPNISILVTSKTSDGQLILKVMRAGAEEYLTLPIHQDELSSALARLRRHRPMVESEQQQDCEIIALAGANGGVGTTSIAVNLGCCLAEKPQNSVAILDLDLALGDADVFLDLIPEYTLADVVQNVSRLDIDLLRKSMTKHQTGVFLLPRPVDLIEAEFISEESIKRVIDLMKESFTHLIIDVSKSYNELDKVAMEAANQVLLITQLDLPCLRNSVRMLMNFDESDAVKDKVDIVVNRTGFEAGQISLRKAKETLNREIYFQIPNDFRTMVDGRNNGVPLITQSPKAGITQAFRRLVDQLSQKVSESPMIAPVDEAEVRGWKRFWPGVHQ